MMNWIGIGTTVCWNSDMMDINRGNTLMPWTRMEDRLLSTMTIDVVLGGSLELELRSGTNAFSDDDQLL